MREEYRDIEGYEGLYQVSNLGRVKSLNYRRTGKERILKPGKDGHGYLQVILWKGGKSKTCKVHRLVAEAFLENPQGLPEINHISEDKTDNSLENLEWVSHEYNCNYGTRIKRIAEANSKALTNHPKLSKSVIAISKVSGLITEFKSIHEAERVLGINNSSIVKCCKGKLKSAGNYYWMYAEEEN